MALYKTEAVVLRTRVLGEADKILSLYTRTEGKVSAVARGVRRGRSRLLGPAQLFAHGRYMIFRGKGGLDTVSQGEIIQPFRPLREDLIRMAYASYAAELVDRLVEERDPIEGLFGLLLGIMHLLADGERLETTTRYFELRLLSQLGYRPQLDHCVGCHGALEQGVRFSPAEGGALCSRCARSDRTARTVGRESLAVMRTLLTLEPSRLGVVRLSRDAGEEMEGLLQGFIEYRLGTRPRSLEFLQSIRMVDPGGEADPGGRAGGYHRAGGD